MGGVPEHVRQALNIWAGFPVERDPRPVVLTGLPDQLRGRQMVDPRWRALMAGPPDPAVRLPEELRPDAEAYTRGLVAEPRLVHGLGPFGTDRGVRQFPAWMMDPGGRRLPWIRMEPDLHRRITWWPKELDGAYDDRVSTLHDDGQTLTYRFVGTPREYADYPTADLYESDTAVYIEPVKYQPRPGGFAYSESREVIVRLAAPLGNRVLIWRAHGPGNTDFGSPRVITTGTPMRRCTRLLREPRPRA